MKAKSKEGMKCPSCGSPATCVVDSRLDKSCRRRRECKECKLRFTTYEILSEQVVKAQQTFDALERVRAALRRALEELP